MGSRAAPAFAAFGTRLFSATLNQQIAQFALELSPLWTY
jgi:hypothetical protein